MSNSILRLIAAAAERKAAMKAKRQAVAARSAFFTAFEKGRNSLHHGRATAS